MASTINASTSSGLVNTADTSGVLQLQTANTTALTIDASQNVGIGTASPVTKLNVVQSTAADVLIRLSNTNAGVYASTLNIDAANATGSRYNSLYSSNGGTYQWSISGGGADSTMAFGTGSSNTERMRITSSGQLMVNTTSITGSPDQMQLYPATTGAFQYGMMIGGNGTGYTVNAMRFVNTYTPAVVGTIVIGSSSTAYNTSSDYRLKENIAPMTGALATVSTLKPVTYKWKLDGKDGQGFIAHELAEVLPEAVTGEKDAVNEDGTPHYQGIDTSFLVATLTAAIQEQQALITDLTTRLAALEGAK